ncbi:MAG TPA: hypothetical protein VFW42_02560 [Fluviicoccus sp.]|nr:hypothetical protein [Fluviicoccus sp.]
MNKAQQELENRLIGDIYDATLAPERWPLVLQGISDLCGGEKNAFLSTDLLNPAANLLFFSGHTEEAGREYREGGFDVLEFEHTGRWMQQIGVGVPSSSDDFFGGPDGYAASGGRYVTDYLNRHGTYRQLIVALELAEFRFAGFGLSNGLDRPFTPDNVAMLGRMTPHMRRALQIHRQLRLVESNNASLYRILDRMSAGVLLLNASGAVAYGNDASARLLREHPALSVTRQEGLRAADFAENQQLQTLIKGALQTGQREGRGVPGGVIGLTSPLSASPLMLTIAPLSACGEYRDLARDQIAAVIFLSNPDAGHQLSARLLEASYGLTAREVELCQRFLNTPVLEAVAEEAGITLSTLRSYLKSVYEKTDCHSQAELMRLLMGLRVNFEHIA